MDILENLQNTKIKHVQLDLFGFCNAACWYCPVRYIPQPNRTRVHMPLSLVEKILIDLDNERNKENGLACNSLRNLYTAHYGEVLLYKHFDEFLELLDKYNFTTTIFSNGLNLTPAKVDLINKHRNVISEIILNIPSFEPELWADRAGFNVNQYDRLLQNLDYADSQLADFENLIMLINGVDDKTWNETTAPGDDLPSILIDTHPIKGERFQAYKFAKRRFKNFTVHREYVLHDRAGLISNLISNQSFMDKKLQHGDVIGCKGYDIETDRTTEWLHINSLGETFLCCNDYNMDYVFGNLADSSLSEIWITKKHAEVIMTARKEICRKCYYAKVG